MLTLAIALCLMFAVVGASMHWAARAQRRHDLREDGHVRDH